MLFILSLGYNQIPNLTLVGFLKRQSKIPEQNLFERCVSEFPHFKRFLGDSVNTSCSRCGKARKMEHAYVNAALLSFEATALRHV